MPLTSQEERCINLACSHLAGVYGGSWKVSDDLDELHQSEASPEVRVSSGEMTAAIEVKRLVADAPFIEYLESMFSLEKYLTPSCGGYYSLNPAIDFRVPMERPFRRYVKREIERVAPTLAPEQSGAILIRREAHVSLVSETGPGYIFCCHNSSGHFVMEVSPRLTGKFMLVDERLWEHSFVTEEGKLAFQDALVKACEARLNGHIGPFTWNEEWELTRGNEEGDESGVLLITVTDARSVPAAVAENVDIMLDKALEKFEDRRWADLHVIVLDRASALMTIDRVHDVLADVSTENFSSVDLVLATDEDDVTQVWP